MLDAAGYRWQNVFLVSRNFKPLQYGRSPALRWLAGAGLRSPRKPLPREIFSPKVAPENAAKSKSRGAVAKLDAPWVRLQRLLRDNGPGERMDREVEAAEASARAVLERHGSKGGG